MKVLAIFGLVFLTLGTLNGLVDLNNKDAIMNKIKKWLNRMLTSSPFGNMKIVQNFINTRFFSTVITIICGFILSLLSIILS